MMNISAFVIHHSSDFDGYFSGAIAIKFLEKQPEFIQINTIPVNYPYNFHRIQGGINAAREKNHVIVTFVLDFSFSSSEMEWLIENSDIMFFCDHHQGSEYIYEGIREKYSNNDKVNFNDFAVGGNFTYMHVDNYNILKLANYLPNDKYERSIIVNFDASNKFAACKLTYNLLFQSPVTPVVIQHVNDIDLSKVKSEETINFKEFLDKISWKNYKLLKNIIFNNSITNEATLMDVIPLQTIYNTFGRLFIERRKETINKLLTRFAPFKIPQCPNLKCGICNNTNGSLTTELLNHACSSLGFDVAIAFYDDLVSGVRGFSLRTLREDLDLNEVVEKITGVKGKGHKRSTGFSLPLEKGVDFVYNNIEKGERSNGSETLIYEFQPLEDDDFGVQGLY